MSPSVVSVVSPGRFLVRDHGGSRVVSWDAVVALVSGWRRAGVACVLVGGAGLVDWYV